MVTAWVGVVLVDVDPLEAAFDRSCHMHHMRHHAFVGMAYES